ncbi:FRG domain-containing protein [Aliivibrio fischeri]|uniref:FRG domain-containing protein n=1 Tax=Aliivibrio fischeri TaxID=668 RepID=A0A844NYQ1_ALIFS|nr:FRG domain-containing protein [Aliivibrio fischeri]MUK48274.1 FRG domain-containing protein [Aliivibrio fischeri]
MSLNQIKEIRIESWKDFKNLLDHRNFRQWIYRGQSDSRWNLESSLYRSITESKKIRGAAGKGTLDINKKRDEEIMLSRFKSSAHLYLSHLPKQNDTFSWLALMQHHGAPTRLLDFSFSAYIALYFALEAGGEDAAVYCVNHNALKQLDEEHFGESRKLVYQRALNQFNNEDQVCLFAFEPEFSNHRLMAQQGLFVASNSIEFTHEQALSEYELKGNEVFKIIIPKELRYEGVRMLHQMNITSGTIYPGLDGFCRSLYQLPIFDSKLQGRVGLEP